MPLNGWPVQDFAQRAVRRHRVPSVAVVDHLRRLGGRLTDYFQQGIA